MKNKLAIAKKNMVLVIVLLCILFSVALSILYRSERKLIEYSKENALKAIADLKINQISAWYVDEVLDADLISKDEMLSELIGTYLRSKSNVDKQHLIRYLKQMETEHMYADVILMNLDGRVLVSTNENIHVADPVDQKSLAKALAEDKSLNSDLFISSHDGKVYLDFIASIKNNKNKKLAGLICRKDPDDLLDPLILSWPSSGETAETYLVKTNSAGIKSVYKPSKTVIKHNCWQVASEKDKLTIDARIDCSGIKYDRNENGENFCAYISPIKNTPWSMIVRAEETELFKTFYASMIEVVIIAVLLMLVCVTGMSLLYRGRKEKYLKDLLEKETDLRQYQERFNTTMDILGEGVCLFRVDDQTIVLTNPRLDEMFGFDRGGLNGQHFSVLLAVNGNAQSDSFQDFVSSLDKERVLNLELQNVKKDGTNFWTTAQVYLLTHDKFGPLWICVLQDITNQKNHEAELIAAKEKAEESDRLKSAFLANMSHEIRTPLNGIIGFSQLLNENNLNEEDVKKYSGYIFTGGNRLLGLLDNILNISSIESGSEVLILKDFKVNDLLTNLYSEFVLQCKEKSIDYKLTLPSNSDGVYLTTDLVKLRQILINFLRNAFQFTKTGFVEMGYTYNESEIEFFVKDSGIGIDPEKREFIFDRFYQGDNSFSSGYEGAGLGLSICAGFSKLMNGEIRIESIFGKGSVFFLKLPLKNKQN